MKKLSAIATVTLAAALTMGSCNDSDYETGEALSYGVAVHSFTLSADTKVLANLDSVFFSIDLVNATIFNADSLPYGTNVKRLVPSITMYDAVSVAELTVPTAKGDTVINYLTTTTDSIDFSRGPVQMRVVSWDGLCERTYSISVNVHQVKSDSLVWNRLARQSLPSTLSAPTEQKTAWDNSNVYCLTRAGSSFSIARTSNPYLGEWSKTSTPLPAGADVSSFAAAADKLYIAIPDGSSSAGSLLYVSSDRGASWTSTGVRVTTVYGSCANQVLANLHTEDGEWKLVDVTTGELTPLPEGMPVSATSNLALYDAPLAGAQHAVMVGGIGADGKSVQTCWGYDGNGQWARLNNVPMEWTAQQMVVVPFVDVRLSTAFQPKEYPTILAFGGRKTDGSLNRTLYVSNDYGMSWKEAPELMQLPEDVPSVYAAQAFVFEGILTDGDVPIIWDELPNRYRIPGTATIGELHVSRATSPVEMWNCPFIFLFGGVQQSGTISPFVWRATFNRLTFKPII